LISGTFPQTLLGGNSAPEFFNLEREHIMNDNTNPTPATPAVNPTRDFINNLIDQFSLHIEGIVERKVLEIFENHATLALINQKMEERIEEMIDSAIHEHESDNQHPSHDDISETIATHIAHTDFTPQVQSAVSDILNDGDYVTEDRVVDIVTDEIDFEEKVKEVLRNI
jgi:hypothetical protein